MVKIKHIIGIGLLVIAVVFGALYAASSRSDSLSRVFAGGDLSPGKLRGAFMATIQRDGPAETYTRLKVLLAGIDAPQQHSIAHIFGNVLYKTNGLSGLTVCDASFGFGCYHSFFGAAISEKGESIVTELDRICVSAYGPMGLGCPHGIGHGLGAYFGPDRIDEQLALCSTLSWKGKYLGCQGGVFMEYNTPTESQSDTATTSVRPFDPDRPYGICQQIDDTFQPACFLELSGWWEQAMGRDYARIGALCRHVQGRNNRDSCFLGIGYAVAQSTWYDLQQTRDACAAAGDADEEMLCTAGAAWSFFANPAVRGQAADVCQRLANDMRADCVKRSDLLSL